MTEVIKGGPKPERPEQQVRSKYSKITREHEVELGATIARIRNEAQAVAEEKLHRLNPEEALNASQRKQLWNQTWRQAARSNPDFIAARDAIAAGHEPLLRAVTNFHYRTKSKHIDKADFSQAGSARLLETAEEFDPNKGFFATYAYRALQNEFLEVSDKGRSIHLPDHASAERKAAREAEEILTQELGRQPTVGEITERINEAREEDKHLSSRRVEFVLHSPSFERAVSVEASAYNDELSHTNFDDEYAEPFDSVIAEPDRDEKFMTGFGTDTLAEPVLVGDGDIPDPNHHDVDEVVADRAEVQKAFSSVSPVQRGIVWDRYANELLLKEIADRTGTSYQNVNQHTVRALGTMRKALGETAQPERERDASAAGTKQSRAYDLDKQGLTHAEIARELGITAGSVRTYLGTERRLRGEPRNVRRTPYKVDSPKRTTGEQGTPDTKETGRDDSSAESSRAQELKISNTEISVDAGAVRRETDDVLEFGAMGGTLGQEAVKKETNPNDSISGGNSGVVFDNGDNVSTLDEIRDPSYDKQYEQDQDQDQEWER